MAKKHSWRFTVRTYEVGASGIVNPAIYLNYLEEAALQASDSLGYGFDWYMAQRRIWLVRKLTIRYFTPAQINDELEITTWISDSRRVQSNRDYSVIRTRDGERILRGRHNWVFVNMDTLLPERIPPAIAESFLVNEAVEPLDINLNDPAKVASPISYIEERRVQYHELDRNQHVNNAVYITWAEQAITNALRAANWPPDRLAAADFQMMRVGREVEYFRSAVDDEPIQIVTQLTETDATCAAWTSDIRHTETNELIAQDRALFAFSDASGARPIPAELLTALTTQPSP